MIVMIPDRNAVWKRIAASNIRHLLNALASMNTKLITSAKLTGIWLGKTTSFALSVASTLN